MCGGMTEIERSANNANNAVAKEQSPMLEPQASPVEAPVPDSKEKEISLFDPETTVFVAPLARSVDKEQLSAHFTEQFGQVTGVLVKYDSFTGESKGFGFVQFATAAEAQTAIAGAKTTLAEVDINIRQYTGPGKGGKGGSRNPNIPSNEGNERTLFVGGLAREATEEDLRAYFATFGGVQSATIKIDAATGNSRGFGFVTFETAEAVTVCMEQNAKHTIREKWVDVKQYGGQQMKGSKWGKGGKGYGFGYGGYGYNAYEQQYGYNGFSGNFQSYDSSAAEAAQRDPHSLFVGGLPQGVTEQDLHVHFSHFGNLREVTIKRDQMTGYPRGFGFVIFESDAGVHAALAARECHTILDKWVDVKKPAPHGPKGSKGKGKGRDNYTQNGYGQASYAGAGYGNGYGQSSQFNSSWGAFGAAPTPPQSFAQPGYQPAYGTQFLQPMVPMQQQQPMQQESHNSPPQGPDAQANQQQFIVMQPAFAYSQPGYFDQAAGGAAAFPQTAQAF